MRALDVICEKKLADKGFIKIRSIVAALEKSTAEVYLCEHINGNPCQPIGEFQALFVAFLLKERVWRVDDDTMCSATNNFHDEIWLLRRIHCLGLS